MKILDIIKGNQISEKRFAKRYNLITPASIQSEGVDELVNIYDLSKSGCRIKTANLERLLKNEYLNINIIYISSDYKILQNKSPIESRVVKKEKHEIGSEAGIYFLDKYYNEDLLELIIEDLNKGRNSQ